MAQLLTRIIRMIAISAAIENHATLPCPLLMTMKAARSGPVRGARVAAYLEDRLGESRLRPGGHARHARRFGMKHRRSHAH